MTAPADGASRPARILSTVVLPQPECPMTQVNSPRPTDNHRSSNTVVGPPTDGKRLVIPSMEMNLSVMSYGERDQPCHPCQHLVEHHANEADVQNRGDDAGDRKIVPLVPDE